MEHCGQISLSNVMWIRDKWPLGYVNAHNLEPQDIAAYSNLRTDQQQGPLGAGQIIMIFPG